jgi:hypothetical protein
VHQLPFGGDRHIGDGGGGNREIENAVGVRRERPEIGREFDAVFGQAGEDAGILAQQFRTRRLQRAGKHRT